MALGVFALALAGFSLSQALRSNQGRGIPLDKPRPVGPAANPAPLEPKADAENVQRDIFPIEDLLTESDEANAAALYLQRLSGLESGKFPLAMRDLSSRIYSDRREQFIALLLKRWAALDVRGALASEIERASDSSKYINFILASWAMTSPT